MLGQDTFHGAPQTSAADPMNSPLAEAAAFVFGSAAIMGTYFAMGKLLAPRTPEITDPFIRRRFGTRT